MHGISDETRILRSHFASRPQFARRFGFTAGTPGDSDPPRRKAPYTDEEREFLMAVDRFQQSTGRTHPTPSDLFRIAQSLGYTRPAVASPDTPVPFR